MKIVELQKAVVSNPFDKAVQFRNEQNWLWGPSRGAAGITCVPPPRVPEAAFAAIEEAVGEALRRRRGGAAAMDGASSS